MPKTLADTVFKNVHERDTYNDIIEKLNRHGKCAMVRCTGFGKTYLMVKLTEKYKKVLYVYPRISIGESIKKKYGDKVKDVKMMTYSTFQKTVNKGDVLERYGFDLVVFDELHCMGAKKCKEALDKIIPYWTNHGTHILGGTATPDRMDGFDVIARYFDNIMTFDYTLGDAIDDGIIKKINYICAMYDTEKSIDNMKKKISTVKDIKAREECMIKLNRLEKAMVEGYNVSKVIRSNMDNIRGMADYFRFIVFFPMQEIAIQREQEIKEWFRRAYPGFKVNTLIVISRVEYKDNLATLYELKPRKGVIDVVLCVDMLNMGYHDNDIDAIIMLRGTKSSIIYSQQVGRCISVDTDREPIIFDFVQNIATDYLFNVTNIQREPRQPGQSVTTGVESKHLIFNDLTVEYKDVVKKLESVYHENTVENILYYFDKKSATYEWIAKALMVREAYVQKVLVDNGRGKFVGDKFEYIEK